MPRIVLLVMMMVVTLNLTTAARTAVDSTDTLIQALLAKKILTEEETAQIRAEVALQRQNEEAVRKTRPVTCKRPLTMTGVIQVRYTHSEKSGDTDYVEVKRARLTLAGDATPVIDFKVQVDFAGAKYGVSTATLNNNATPNTLTTTTDAFSKPLLLDAMIGYTPYRDMKFTVGQFYIPFGLENTTADSQLATINRSQTTELLVPGRDNGAQGRDNGIQWSGARVFGMEQCSRLDYALGIFNGAGINSKDDNGRKDLAARVVYTPGIAGFTLGLSHYTGARGTSELTHRATGGELLGTYGAWRLRGEYIDATTGSVKKHGWYGLLARQITSAAQVVVRYDAISANAVAKSTAPTSSWTYGMNYAFGKDALTRWQLNYEQKRETNTQVRNDLLLAQLQACF